MRTTLQRSGSTASGAGSARVRPVPVDPVVDAREVADAIRADEIDV
jgi:hypothetical protein